MAATFGRVKTHAFDGFGLCAFRKHELEVGGLIQLQVEARSSVTHTLYRDETARVVAAGVKTPKEAVLKERLRALLT